MEKKYIIFKTIINNINAYLIVDDIKIKLDEEYSLIKYNIIEPIKGEILYEKYLRYDNVVADENGIKQYPSFDDWYGGYNSTDFLYSEFFNNLTNDEKQFIININ
jgi:hypothetical protein